jgi:hypothetical protein
MRDEALLAAAQRDARALIADDPELEREGSRRIRETLDERYRERLAMYGVG